MPMIPLIAVMSWGCGTGLSGTCPPPTVREVRWIQDDVVEELPDAISARMIVVPDGMACEPSARILLFGWDDSYLVALDLAAYASGAAVITPTQPDSARPPTLFRFRPIDPAITEPDSNLVSSWSGGPASFSVDADFVHTLTLEAPVRCVETTATSWCEPSTPITFAFTGPLDEVCTTPAVAAEGPSPAGLPYCIEGGLPGPCEGGTPCYDTP